MSPGGMLEFAVMPLDAIHRPRSTVSCGILQLNMGFDIPGGIEEIETIATGAGIRELRRLKRHYGETTWRKRKGIASIRLNDGCVMRAELHWYEGHGVGKREVKIKRLLED